MNSYEARIEARRERLERAVERAERLSSSMISSARTMADAIPFGQPILVGHHSEKRDRNYRAKIERRFSRGFELMKKAERLRGVLAGVGSAGISSDDPEAVVKLREELAKVTALGEKMVKANFVCRTFYKAGCRDENSGAEIWARYLVKIREVIPEISEARAKDLLNPAYSFERPGFPGYALSNNSANRRRIEARIATLLREAKRAEVAGDVEKVYGEIRYREDVGENRVMLMFPGKPAEEVRKILKSNGFRWSPSRGAWVRMLNSAGRNAADYVIGLINSKKEVA